VKRYDQEFKRDAVSMLINSGKPLKQVAKELGVSDASLRDWREEYLEALEGRSAMGEGGPTPRDLVAENQRLRKELERVTWQRDILKKAGQDHPIEGSDRFVQRQLFFLLTTIRIPH